MIGGMAPTPYGEILARRIREVRAAKRLGQELVAARMRNLGFSEWTRQTVGSTEKPTRRVTAAEVVGLALVMETTVPKLLMADAGVPGGPEEEKEAVVFPDGELSPDSLARLLTGLNDKSIRWEGDKPVFTAGKSAWMAGDPDAPDFVKAAWAREDET